MPDNLPVKRRRSDDVTGMARLAALALAKELGPEKVTIEGVAARSGIAKTTIYRRWPNAAALIMDAFLEDIHPFIAYRPAPNLRSTFIRALEDLSQALTGPRMELLRHLLGAAQFNDDLADAFWNNWIGPRREGGLELIMAAGYTEAEGNVMLDMMFGAFYYRMLIPYAEINTEWITAVVTRTLGEARKPAPRTTSANRQAG